MVRPSEETVAGLKSLYGMLAFKPVLLKATFTVVPVRNDYCTARLAASTLSIRELVPVVGGPGVPQAWSGGPSPRRRAAWGPAGGWRDRIVAGCWPLLPRRWPRWLPKRRTGYCPAWFPS